MSLNSEFLNRPLPQTISWLGRVRLAGAFVVSFGLFWLGSLWLHVPLERGMAGSILLQSNPIAAFLLVILLLVFGSIVGQFLVGNLVPGNEPTQAAGLFIGSMGLLALAIRAGNVRYVLFAHPSATTFLAMAGESVLLLGVLIGAWCILRKVAAAAPPVAGRETEPPTGTQEKPADEDGSIGNMILATLTQAAVMMAILVFIAQSEAKKQAVAAVGISAIGGGIGAYLTFPLRSCIWYWMGPSLAAVILYLVNYASPAGISIGFPQGALGTGARAVPLDFASIGTAGAILGYWIAYNLTHQEASD